MHGPPKKDGPPAPPERHPRGYSPNAAKSSPNQRRASFLHVMKGSNLSLVHGILSCENFAVSYWDY